MDTDTSFYLPAALVLGVPEMDAQHGALFAQLAEIKSVCLAANHLPETQAEALLSALDEHFATEERLAEENDVEFSEHTRTHGAMFAAIQKALAHAGSGSKDVFGLLRYVEYWFERHIAEEDRHLSQRLAHPRQQREFAGYAPVGHAQRAHGEPRANA